MQLDLSAPEPEGSCVRGIYGDETAFRLMRWKTGARDEETVRRISLERIETLALEATGEDGNVIAHQFLWTGIDCLIFDRLRSVLVSCAPEPDPASTLTIVYPDVSSNRVTNGLIIDDTPIVNRLDYAVSLFCGEGAEGARDVRTVRFPKQDFNLRLRLSLLAGDADFDIVYVEDGRSLLDPLLRNRLYLPLETDPAVAENFRANYLPGIAGIMTDEGHLWGVPFRLTADALLCDLSLFDDPAEAERIRREGWTAAEYWAFCDAAGEPVTNMAAELLIGLCEDGLRNASSDRAGSLDRDAAAEILSEMLERADAGTLWNDNRPTCLSGCAVPALDPDLNGLYDQIPSLEGKVLLPLPGTQYADVSSYIFAYGGTAVPELCLGFMRVLTDRYWVTMFENGRSCMAADSGAYHYYLPALTFSFGSTDEPVSIGQKAEALNREAGAILSRCLCGRTTVRDREDYLALSGIIARVWNGTVTPEEGADEFAGRFGARLYE